MESMYFDPAYFSLPCDWCIGSQYFKADYGWQWNDGLGGSGNNESGFTGLPGGIRDGEEDWGSRAAGRIGAWWSPHESEDFVGLSRQYDPSDDAIVGQMSLNSGRSVRCVLDAPQVLGCTEASACNYDEQANNDDGSCEYESCVPAIHPCGDPVSYQGYEYATVQIGEQCWFAENLRNEYYQNGDSIDSNLSQDEWVNAEGGATVVYGGAAECENPGVMFECGCMEAYSPDINACDPVQSLEEYGRLYNWHAVNDARGLCPVGWRVPTDDEWIGLELALGMDTSEAYLLGGRGSYYDSEGIDVGVGWKMRTEYGWASWGDAGNGSNSSGFSGLPGGSRGSVFGNAGYTGTFWTSTLNLDNLWTAFYRELYTNSIRNVSNHSSGHSVRCIEQELVLGCTNPSACNYNPTANQEDGTCTGISIESCDCNGNVLDAIGECGGSCTADDDGDGICDDVDDCIGQYDPCGTCNGTCSGPLPGCVDSEACNYNELADYDDGSCEYESCAPSFQGCGDPVSYQGYDYATVQIGDQCWFAENLRSENYENGDSIPQILQLADWVTDFAGVGATTLFGSGNIYCEGASPEIDPCNSSEALQAFGRLYNWHAVNDERGLCPQGWHIPLDEEWTSLENGLGGSSIAGGKLKANFGWTDGSGTNESGFYALPGGQFYSEGFWNGYGNEGLWWSSTVHGVEGWDAWSRRMYGGNNGIYRVSYETGNALSVRCIQDPPEVLGCMDTSACNFNELANTDDGSCEYESCAPSLHPCGDPVGYQGYDYTTVLIGEQCWFAENLRSENYSNGDAITSNLTNEEWPFTTSGATTIFGQGDVECSVVESAQACDELWSLEEYGRLYNWHSVIDNRGLCPSGWHVPTDNEWFALTDFLGDSSGFKMATTTGWSWNQGTNSSGFSGKPGGDRTTTRFQYEGFAGNWWSSTSSEDEAWRRQIATDAPNLGRFQVNKNFGLSVRCLQDALEVLGCTDSSACNYDELANTDSGTCEYESCVQEFVTCGDPVSYQGYDYATVQIGEQCWFAENLRSENYLNGDDIAAGLNDSGWSLNTTGAVAVYGEGNSECESYSPDGDACDEAWSLNEYGRLYNWWAVIDDRGLCPAGWHVSTDSDWTVVTEYLGGFEVAGGAMKTDYGWVVSDASNSSGFSCLPGGWKGESGNFRLAGESARFWTSSSHGSGPIGKGLDFVWFKVSETWNDAESGFSIRCIQDNPGVLGCVDASACNYDELANEDDGSCNYVSCAGCTDNTACNFDPGATIVDGSCDYSCWDLGLIPGCMIPNACNYDPWAEYCPSGNCCILPAPGYCDCQGNVPDALGECGGNCLDIPEGDCDCNGNVLDAIGTCGGQCTADEDSDGICDDEDWCIGTWDSCGVCNGDNSSCLGCTIGCASNYNPAATYDDGSCYFEGCCDPNSPEYAWCDPNIPCYDDGSCWYWPEGCTDSSACNWDSAAIEDDGSCEYESCAPVLHPCGDPVSYQGYEYATVQIGEQCWFAENLQSQAYQNGDAIPGNLSDSEWESTLSGATTVLGEGDFECYSLSPEGNACDDVWSLQEYGRLYNWYAVSDSRGLCPNGWHVPTDGEWMTLESTLGMSASAANDTGFRGTNQGSQLKSSHGWYNGNNGTDDSGFGGLPGGYRNFWFNGYFNTAGMQGVWWSSSPDDTDAWYRLLTTAYDESGQSSFGGFGEHVFRLSSQPQVGFSVRCIQNTEE